MATATMGPPLDPREPPRRSHRAGRRQNTSGTGSSGSTSKSPELAVPPENQMRPRENGHRPPLPSKDSTSRPRRPKTDEIDDAVPQDEHPKPGVLNGSTVQNGRAPKRKAKASPSLEAVASAEPAPTNNDQNTQLDKDDSGDTRCICGRDDEVNGQFWIGCDTCGVWQHGPCMGVFDEAEAKSPDFQYFCERCRPDRHPELLERKKSKRPRQSPVPTHAPPRSHSHSSRSRSPAHPAPPKQTKRRNTMNSRDAEIDDQIAQILQATAAEAEAANKTVREPELDAHTNGRAKRKRTAEEDSRSAKRTRSGSVASDMPPPSIIREPTPLNGAVVKPLPPPPPPALKAAPKNNKRGSVRKPPPVLETPGAESEEVTTPVQRKSSGGRSKPSATPSKRAGVTSSIQSGESLRRNNTNALPTPTSAAASRAYHQTHAYVVSQQQLLTSWHLPDYLAHLEAMLPTGIPRPLEVRSSAVAGARESMEHTMERGVKVRWPSKRTSVGDMTKRVRAILEWVGREQAAHAERQRRTDVLRLSLGAVMSSSSSPPVSADLTTSASTGQVLGSDVSASPMQEKDVLSTLARSCSSTDPASSAASILDPSKSTTALMEEIMEELIGFQEKYSRSRS